MDLSYYTILTHQKKTIALEVENCYHMESKNASALVVKGLSRLPVTEEIAGSNPVERATKKRHHTDDVFSWCGPA